MILVKIRCEKEQVLLLLGIAYTWYFDGLLVEWDF